MKKIGITQRVDEVESYLERRDSLDQRWHDFAIEIDACFIPLPNIEPSKTKFLLDSLELDGIVLSGGNSLEVFDPKAVDVALERDMFEREVISYALDKSLPIIGVCRGMQMLNSFFGGGHSKLEGHVAVRHSISVVESDTPLSDSVNSYHRWGIKNVQLAEALRPLALDDDMNVEAFRHINTKMCGIMWHPEREAPFNSKDIDFFKRFFND